MLASYGAVVSTLMEVGPLKNSTWVTWPSSVAVAERVIVPVVEMAVPPCGLVNVTVGAEVVGVLTVIVMPGEVVVKPALSVALAVMTWLPAGNEAVIE